jgi:hypothetical protein
LCLCVCFCVFLSWALRFQDKQTLNQGRLISLKTPLYPPNPPLTLCTSPLVVFMCRTHPGDYRSRRRQTFIYPLILSVSLSVSHLFTLNHVYSLLSSLLPPYLTYNFPFFFPIDVTFVLTSSNLEISCFKHTHS